MYIPAGMAANGPPLGTMLGQRGINIAAFCKDFNDKTAHMIEGVPIPVRTSVNPDRSYNLHLMNPPVSYYLKQAAGIHRCSESSREDDNCGWVTLKHVYEIAKIKNEDHSLQLESLEKVCKMVIGTARSMGIKVVKDYDPKEYAEFRERRAVQVEAQLQRLQEIREEKLLRK